MAFMLSVAKGGRVKEVSRDFMELLKKAFANIRLRGWDGTEILMDL